MQPGLLAARCHHEQITIAKLKVVSFPGLPVTELKGAARADRQGRNRLIGVDLRLVVGMPTHAVVSMPIEIEQTAIERRVSCRPDPREQRLEPVGPTLAAMDHAAVAVGEPRIGQVKGETGHRMLPPIHPHHRLLPQQPLRKKPLPVPTVGFR